MPGLLSGDTRVFEESERDRTDLGALFVSALVLMPTLFGDILPNDARNMMLAAGCVLAFAYFLCHRDFNLYGIGICAFWLLFATFALVNRYVTGGAITFPFFALPMIALIACCSTCSIGWFREATVCVMVMLGIHLAATLLFYVFPELYASTVKPWFFADERAATGYQSGLTAHYSNNGQFMATGFLLASCLAMSSNANKRRRWTAVSALFLFALVLTQKRAHLLLSIFSLVCVFSISNIKGKALKISVVAIVAFLVLTIAATYVPGVATSLERLVGTFESGDIAETTTGRIYLWETALAGWWQSPIMGNGWGSFVYVWPGGNLSIYAHNELLQLMNDVGLVGLLLFVLLALGSLRIAYANVKWINAEKDAIGTTMKCAAYFPFAYEIFMLTYACTTGSLLQAPIDYIPFFLAVAMSAALRSCLNHRKSEGLRYA